MYKERFLLAEPKPVKPICTTTGKIQEYGIYLDSDNNPMRWSGTFPIPKIGDKIEVTMNRIGPAIVTGYFDAGDRDKGEKITYVGVMAKPTNPPAWLVKQNKESQKQKSHPEWMKQGIGCFYGVEFKPA